MPLHGSSDGLPSFIKEDRGASNGDGTNGASKSAGGGKSSRTKLRFKKAKKAGVPSSSGSGPGLGSNTNADGKRKIPRRPDLADRRHRGTGLDAMFGEQDDDAAPVANARGCAMEHSGCRILWHSARREPRHRQYSVQSQSDPGTYYSVDLAEGCCSCKSHARRQAAALAAFDIAHPCKHILYVRIVSARNPGTIEHAVPASANFKSTAHSADPGEGSDPCVNDGQYADAVKEGWREKLARWRKERDSRGPPQPGCHRDSTDDDGDGLSDGRTYARGRPGRARARAAGNYDVDISDHEASGPEEDDGGGYQRWRRPGDFDASYFKQRGWGGFDPKFFERKRKREQAEANHQHKSRPEVPPPSGSSGSAGHGSASDHHQRRPTVPPDPVRRAAPAVQTRPFDVYVGAWAELEARGSCRADELPWPGAGELESFFRVDAATAKQRYRKLIMLMHPDKFLQRYGNLLPDSELETVMPTITLLSQRLNSLKR